MFVLFVGYRVYAPAEDQEAVFDEVQPMITSLLDGLVYYVLTLILLEPKVISLWPGQPSHPCSFTRLYYCWLTNIKFSS